MRRAGAAKRSREARSASGRRPPRRGPERLKRRSPPPRWRPVLEGRGRGAGGPLQAGQERGILHRGRRLEQGVALDFAVGAQGSRACRWGGRPAPPQPARRIEGGGGAVGRGGAGRVDQDPLRRPAAAHPGAGPDLAVLQGQAGQGSRRVAPARTDVGRGVGGVQVPLGAPAGRRARSCRQAARARETAGSAVWARLGRGRRWRPPRAGGALRSRRPPPRPGGVVSASAGGSPALRQPAARRRSRCSSAVRTRRLPPGRRRRWGVEPARARCAARCAVRGREKAARQRRRSPLSARPRYTGGRRWGSGAAGWPGRWWPGRW